MLFLFSCQKNSIPGGEGSINPPGFLVFTGFPSQPGEYYEATFTGVFTADETSVQHIIKGSFKMKRIL